MKPVLVGTLLIALGAALGAYVGPVNLAIGAVTVGVVVGLIMLVGAKRFLIGLGVALVALVAVVIANTMRLSDAPAPVPPAESLAIDVDAAAERLAGALRIRTISQAEEPKTDPAAFDALHRYLRENFPLAHTRLSTETVNRHGLLFTWKGEDPSLQPALLMAHQDVVPVEDPSKWTHPPFEGVIADGYIWGRGTLDVKQGVVGILEAAEFLLKTGYQPKRTLYFAFGHDEEIGGRDGAKAIVKLLESRGVSLAFVVDEGGVLTKGVVPDVDDWVALIGVAEKGYMSLSLKTKGTGGHSSMPPKQTAVGVLTKAIAALEANPFPPRLEGSEEFFMTVAPRMPFLQRMVFANLWLFRPVLIAILSQKPSTNATLRTTTAATMFTGGVKDNILPTEAEAVVNFRIIPGDTPQSVRAYVESVVDDERVTVGDYGQWADDPGAAEGASSPTKFSSTDGEGFVALSETIRQVAQDPKLIVAPYLVLGATDARHFEGIAKDSYRFLFNRFGPDDLDRIHGTDERISVENYGETVQFYALFIRRVGRGSSPESP